MIIIPKDLQPGTRINNEVLGREFLELVKYFNDLEESLRYPNCEGDAEARRILRAAERELTLWGKV